MSLGCSPQTTGSTAVGGFRTTGSHVTSARTLPHTPAPNWWPAKSPTKPMSGLELLLREIGHAPYSQGVAPPKLFKRSRACLKASQVAHQNVRGARTPPGQTTRWFHGSPLKQRQDAFVASCTLRAGGHPARSALLWSCCCTGLTLSRLLSSPRALGTRSGRGSTCVAQMLEIENACPLRSVSDDKSVLCGMCRGNMRCSFPNESQLKSRQACST